MHSSPVFFASSILVTATMNMIAPARAYKSNLRRRTNDPTDPVTCPCFDMEHDSYLIAATIDNIDLHRIKSCTSTNAKVERIYWTPIAADERPNVDILLPIDGVKYNYLKAVYDSDAEYYSCERNDYRMAAIEPNEAQACMALLSRTCDEVLPEMCQSFDLTGLERIKNEFEIGDLIVDTERSCNASSGSYGIYAKDIDEAVLVSDGTTHCSNMMDEACSELSIVLPPVDSCVDDPDFILHGNSIAEEFEAAISVITGSSSTIKNCAWVAENPSRRCKVLSKNGDAVAKRAFEYCRSTCGKCKCTESNGADCCKDNSSSFRYLGQGRSCEWLNGNQKRKSKRCAKRVIAKNCPHSCGFCPA